MTIEELQNRGLIVYECISGSRAYGLDTPESDTDIKGVFILPQDEIYGLNYTAQVSNETNDIVYYELGRFIELLAVNNPNIMELLATPESSIIYKHPIMYKIKADAFLSKLCRNTFGKYAMSQIKKAKGLKKKILNPIDKERKSVLDFCYVNYNNGSIPLLKFLTINTWTQEHCGLVNITHMKDLFGLYYNEEKQYSGIVKKADANQVALSSIDNGQHQEALLSFNKDGYSFYCKEYKEYWDWVGKRNDIRYENTLEHGKNYDAKNMLHTFRLLEMCKEIGREGVVNVFRQDREQLLKIKSGYYQYGELLRLAEEKQVEIDKIYANSSLQNAPDYSKVNLLLAEMRREYYEL
jgi:predicted nucleotidyltransferase